MISILSAVFLSAAAGVLGTGLGGLLGLIFLRRSRRALPYLMAFAAGVMAGVAAFELIPEAMLYLSVWETLLGTAAGAAAVMLLQLPVDRICETSVSGETLTRSGLLTFAAIGLHNLPEGLAIGAGSGYDLKMGLTIALLIALHDVPEGMSVAVPLYSGGMRKASALLFTILSGLPTLLGGALGTLFGAVSLHTVAFSLAGAGGAMLYVTFCDLLPEAARLDPEHKSPFLALLGVLAGLLAAALAH